MTRTMLVATVVMILLALLLAGCTPCTDHCVSHVRVNAGGAEYMARHVVYRWGRSRWEVYDLYGTLVSHFGPQIFEELVADGMTYETMGEAEWLQAFDRPPMNLYPSTQPEGE